MDVLPSRYNPKQVEERIYKFWQDRDLFSAQANARLPGEEAEKNPFCIVIPPPNITGILHMGHALNNTYQDILIRFKKMKGYESLWMPGTDHAGIATQNVVERQLAQEGLARNDLGREEFIKRLWAWKKEYGDTIIHQLKKLGCACDWRRTRFTMDDGYSLAVKEVFIHLFNKGLIYQGNYIINWCPRCQTALSDEEAQHREIEGRLYFIKYPLQIQERKSKPGEFMVVATTRPETMLGDTAVAVNLKDRRYRKLVGKTVILPLVERPIKIITDPAVDPKFGTGAVKVTPAHDPNDFEIALRHNLEFINIMEPDGRINKNGADFAGMDRFEAREAIIEELKQRQLLEKVITHKHSLAHCYRCHTVIEPYLSKQWFVNMKPLAEPAIEAVKSGKIKFYPTRWTKVYLNWMQDIRDWCISRQIWWGHRIPVYYCKNCQETGKSQIPNLKSQINSKSQIPNSKQESGIIVSRTRPAKCPKCGSTQIVQDEDVLDTWFSSWLWPFATFGWPFKQKDLDYFYPTSVLVTAPEIIFFWVARMIMAGLEFMKEIPFTDVYIHGTVRDITGKKMSKSLGNIIDPIKIIEKFGCDALRYCLVSTTATGQDIFLSEEKFQYSRNFANKIWNASRFTLMNLKPDVVGVDLCQLVAKEDLEIPERWILSRLYQTLDYVEKRLNSYHFNDAAKALYEFFWHEFCDWYLELAKFNIQDKHTQVILYKVLEKSLRLLHPFMPFITEEIWQILNRDTLKSIMQEPWPHLQKDLIDRAVDKKMDLFFQIVTTVRNLRKYLNIDNSKKISLIISVSDIKTKKIFLEFSHLLSKILSLEELKYGLSLKKPAHAVSAVVGNLSLFIPLSGVVDFRKEKQRLNKQIEKLETQLNAVNLKLKNRNFLNQAPQDIIQGHHKKREELEDSLTKLRQIIHAFK